MSGLVVGKQEGQQRVLAKSQGSIPLCSKPLPGTQKEQGDFLIVAVFQDYRSQTKFKYFLCDFEPQSSQGQTGIKMVAISW